jgi:hypothetical protein
MIAESYVDFDNYNQTIQSFPKVIYEAEWGTDRRMEVEQSLSYNTVSLKDNRL